MLRITDVSVDHIRDESCAPTREDPNGRFPHVTIEFAQTGSYFKESVMGKTCACGKGHKTYGTWRLPNQNMLFESKEALMHYLEGDDNYGLAHKVETRLNPTSISQYW